ncbi:MAG TPA: GYF domain-containing protein [Polyangiaceae bacterium]|nr:GYF domain-containing protein [Polyangiaceae bacterium]
MAVLSSSSSTEEWYVGINGVPVGPVRLSDLRRKAANGLISEESLVWREGFEEWVPLRTFPELAAILKESATSGRTSLTPTPSAAAPIPANRVHSPLPRTPAAPAGSGIRPSVTPRGVASQSRSNVLAFATRGATAEKIDGLNEPNGEEHIKVDESVRPPAAASPEIAVEPGVALVPAAPVLPEVFEPAQFRGPGFGSRVQQSRRAHPALWIVVALGGMLLGVGAMVVLLPKSNVKPAVQIVSVMVPAPAAPTTQSAESEGNTTIGPIEVNAPVVTGKASGSKASKAAAAEPAAPGGPAAPLSTSLTGLGGLVGGPSAPSGGSASSGGGGQLQTVDVERVVQSHRAFVKRQCWEPALGAKAPNSPSSARVVVTINVARDGTVPSVTTTGGDGYPGLANCVQGQVKNWRFPPSDGSAVTVPFVFAAQ